MLWRGALGAAVAVLAAAGPAAAGEFVANGGFEGTLGGWQPANARLSLVEPGATGTSAALVERRSSSSYGVYTSPAPVRSTTAGIEYRAAASIRANRTGRRLCLAIREWSGSSLAGSAQVCVTSDGGWQRIASLSYRAKASGRLLDLYAYQSSAGSGDAFRLDDVTLVDVPPPPPPPPPGPPDTAIASGPSGTIATDGPRFTFTSTPAGASFECDLDGAGFAPCEATHTAWAPAGGHTLRVRAVNAAGPDATPAEASWWADPWLQNGTFELAVRGWDRQNYAVAGWKGYEATLATVGGGVAGPTALRATQSSAASSVYSSPKPVNATVAGRTYAADGWFRSDLGGAVCLRMREFAAGAAVGQAQACATATAAWQRFPTVRYTAKAAGNELEVDVNRTGAAGDWFEVDGLALDAGPRATAPAPGPDPVLLATADVASCWSSGDEAVARLVDGLAGTVAIAGDTEQNYGSPAEYDGCYEPAWGRHKARTRPAVGDHEYREPGAAGFFGYYGPSVGKGWYSYDAGAWHVVVLNSNCAQVGGCGPGSEQFAWLRADLAANAKECTAAYFHHPRWSVGTMHGDQAQVDPFWQLLYAYGAELVWGGNDHTYQRWAPQRPDGTRDDARGLRQFVVGTGGTIHYQVGAPRPNTEVAHAGTFGVLELTLRAGSYAWRFVPQEGKTFTDSGSTPCSPLVRDTEGPDTRIESGPPETTTATTAEVTFAAADAVEFQCAVDGGAWTACVSPLRLQGLAAGDHVVAVRGVDVVGNPDGTPAERRWRVEVAQESPPPPPPPAQNLLPNGSFDAGLDGWTGYRGDLSAAPDPAAGAGAMRVTWQGSGSGFSAFANPRPATTAAAGEAYEAAARLRAARAGAVVCVRLREWSGGVLAGGAQACVVADGTWQTPAGVRYTALQAGSQIDLDVYLSGPAAGDAFDVDEAMLTRIPA